MKKTKISSDKEQNITKDTSLFKLGIQFGHQKARRHPSMKKFIYGMHNNRYIIDVEKSKQKIDEALDFLKEIAQSGKQIVFLGNKPNIKNFLKKFAQDNKLFFITERWIGGTLTNFDTVKERLKRYKEIEEKMKSQEWQELTKKEQRDYRKEQERLEKLWGGIKNLKGIPAVLFLLDVPNNYLAIREAKKAGVKIVAIADTDANIRDVDYPIPANDDSLLTIKYILQRVIDTLKKNQPKKDK
jgi:small subunit ribosomal protein S2